MRGISEEWIRKSLEITREDIDSPGMVHIEIALENLLLNCYELNAWKRIDENTPKNRQILLFYPEHKTPAGTLEPYIAAMPYNALAQIVYVPTHWQELPTPPKNHD